MKFKKVVSAVLVSALAVSMMAGCGSKSGSSDSKSDNKKLPTHNMLCVGNPPIRNIDSVTYSIIKLI